MLSTNMSVFYIWCPTSPAYFAPHLPTYFAPVCACTFAQTLHLAQTSPGEDLPVPLGVARRDAGDVLALRHVRLVLFSDGHKDIDRGFGVFDLERQRGRH
jgi:hypothetical protein